MKKDYKNMSVEVKRQSREKDELEYFNSYYFVKPRFMLLGVMAVVTVIILIIVLVCIF